MFGLITIFYIRNRFSHSATCAATAYTLRLLLMMVVVVVAVASE